MIAYTVILLRHCVFPFHCKNNFTTTLSYEHHLDAF